ncbi:hypothetical protein IQ06DRAFT_44555 [Phaeosphaeriaceae sp. SRC1lsM3a]|nr:hypothetical protein IQ06DRAFT_44555 [Stagonospora sp. SRC1lsM3a]
MQLLRATPLRNRKVFTDFECLAARTWSHSAQLHRAKVSTSHTQWPRPSHPVRRPRRFSHNHVTASPWVRDRVLRDDWLARQVVRWRRQTSGATDTTCEAHGGGLRKCDGICWLQSRFAPRVVPVRGKSSTPTAAAARPTAVSVSWASERRL